MTARRDYKRLLSRKRFFLKDEILATARAFLKEKKPLPDDFYYAINMRYGGTDDVAAEVEDLEDAHYKERGLKVPSETGTPLI